jgi:hypothetical protein
VEDNDAGVCDRLALEVLYRHAKRAWVISEDDDRIIGVGSGRQRKVQPVGSADEPC